MFFLFIFIWWQPNKEAVREPQGTFSVYFSAKTLHSACESSLYEVEKSEMSQEHSQGCRNLK